MPAVSGEEALKLLQKIWKMTTADAGFEKILHQVAITSAGNGSCSAEFVVEKGFTNQMETLHGGCTAALVDCISTLGLMTIGDQKPGVSVSLCVNYLKGAKLGSTIQLDSKTTKLGKTLAYLDIVLKDKQSGALVATSSHIKYVA